MSFVEEKITSSFLRGFDFKYKTHKCVKNIKQMEDSLIETGGGDCN